MPQFLTPMPAMPVFAIFILAIFCLVALFIWVFVSSSSSRAPAPPAFPSHYSPRVPDDLNEPAPEVSCFAKGIIRSMKEMPDDWTYEPGYESILKHRSHIGHATDLQIISLYRGRQRPCGWHLTEHTISPTDMLAIETDGIKPMLAFKRLQQQQAYQRERDAKLGPVRAAFEKLGCPSVSDSIPNPPSS